MAGSCASCRASPVRPTGASKCWTLLQVRILEDDRKATAKSVERLMGNKAEARFDFIQERAEFADESALDV
jgi:topoisomerase-4 subunit B